MQTNDLNVAAGAGALHPSRVDNVWSQDASAATSPTWCRHDDPTRCPTFDAIRVELDDHFYRVRFHGEFVGVYRTPMDAAIAIDGLHAGAHLEARQWRWSQPGGMQA